MKKIHLPSRVLLLILCFLVTGVLFFMLNKYTPLFADDYSYSLSFATGERLQSFADIPASQYAHYQDVNGRFVTHTLAQAFLLLGKDAFNIINIFAFLLLGVLIYYHAAGTLQNAKASVFALIYCLLFLCTPAFGQSFLWLDGAATYLYGILLMLVYLIPYRHVMTAVKNNTYVADHPLISILKFIGMLILGVLAGNASENLSAAAIIAIGCYLIWFKLNKVKLHFWMFGLGNLIGLFLLLTAPGHAKKLAISGGVSIFGIVRNLFMIGARFLQYYQIPLLIVCFILILILMVKSFKKPSFAVITAAANRLALPIIYGLTTLCAAFSMIFSPWFPDRAWSCVTAFMIISLISFEGCVRPYLSQFKKVSAAVLVCLITICAGIYCTAFFENKLTYVYNANREAYIQQCAAEGNTEIEIPAITSKSPYCVFNLTPDLEWDSTIWPNTSIAKYYNVEKIIRAQEDLHN